MRAERVCVGGARASSATSAAARRRVWSTRTTKRRRHEANASVGGFGRSIATRSGQVSTDAGPPRRTNASVRVVVVRLEERGQQSRPTPVPACARTHSCGSLNGADSNEMPPSGPGLWPSMYLGIERERMGQGTNAPGARQEWDDTPSSPTNKPRSARRRGGALASRTQSRCGSGGRSCPAAGSRCAGPSPKRGGVEDASQPTSQWRREREERWRRARRFARRRDSATVRRRARVVRRLSRRAV